MKKIYGFILFVMISLSVMANGSKERFTDLEDFTGVSNECSAEVFIEKGDYFDVRVEGDSDDIDKLEMRVRQGVLHIRMVNSFSIFFLGSRDIEVHITMPELETLTATGSGNVYVADRFKTREVRVSLTGSGEAEADWECETLEVKLSGSGDFKSHSKAEYLDCVQTGSGEVTMSGVSRIAKVKLTGSGDFDGKDWKTETMEALMTGSGNARFTVTKELSAVMTGSGDIDYNSNGNRIVKNITSTGSGNVDEM